MSGFKHENLLQNNQKEVRTYKVKTPVILIGLFPFYIFSATNRS